MHIYYYGNTTFEEAVATVQPPQVQLSILFCSEGNTFHTYFTEFWIFLQWSLSIQGEILLPFPAWSAGSELWFPCAPAVSTLQHPPCTNVQNFWGAQIHLLPGAQPMKSQSHSGQYLWTLQEHHWKTNCHSGQTGSQRILPKEVRNQTVWNTNGCSRIPAIMDGNLVVRIMSETRDPDS